MTSPEKESTSGGSQTAGVSLKGSSFVFDFIVVVSNEKCFLKTNIPMVRIFTRVLEFCTYCSRFSLAVLHSIDL